MDYTIADRRGLFYEVLYNIFIDELPEPEERDDDGDENQTPHKLDESHKIHRTLTKKGIKTCYRLMHASERLITESELDDVQQHRLLKLRLWAAQRERTLDEWQTVTFQDLAHVPNPPALMFGRETAPAGTGTSRVGPTAGPFIDAGSTAAATNPNAAAPVPPKNHHRDAVVVVPTDSDRQATRGGKGIGDKVIDALVRELQELDVDEFTALDQDARWWSFWRRLRTDADSFGNGKLFREHWAPPDPRERPFEYVGFRAMEKKFMPVIVATCNTAKAAGIVGPYQEHLRAFDCLRQLRKQYTEDYERKFMRVLVSKCTNGRAAGIMGPHQAPLKQPTKQYNDENDDEICVSADP